MTYLLQVDFKMEGPFGEEMSKGFAELAQSINDEPGMIWKIWTEDAAAKEAGGVYLFETKETATSLFRNALGSVNVFRDSSYSWQDFRD